MFSTEQKVVLAIVLLLVGLLITIICLYPVHSLFAIAILLKYNS